MFEAQLIDSMLQHFSTENLTKEKFRNVFCSEKAEYGKSTTDKILMTLKEPMQKQQVTPSITSFNTLVDSKKNIDEEKKPNFRKLCAIVALKLGFNVNSKGSKLLIDAILYLYNNNIDICRLEQIYDVIGQKYSMKKNMVRWNIDNALKTMHRYSDPEMLFAFFSEYDGRPLAAKQFIILSVYELRKHFTPEGYTKEQIERILYSM